MELKWAAARKLLSSSGVPPRSATSARSAGDFITMTLRGKCFRIEPIDKALILITATL